MPTPTIIDEAVRTAGPQGASPTADAQVRRARVLARLAESDALARADRPAFLREMTHCLADTLGVERVTVWCFEDERSRLVCRGGWEHGVSHEGGEPALAATDHRQYFAMLRSGRTVGVADTRAEAGFPVAAIGGDEVRSVLHVPIRLHGRLVGVVRHEHVGVPRRWSPDEEQFARSASDLLSLLLVAEGRASVESSLRDSEERYRDLVETMDDVLYVVEPDGRVTSLNRAFERCLGWSREEWLGKHFAALVHPDDLPIAAVVQERVLAGESPVEVELRFRHRDGGWRVGELRAAARRSAGVVTGVIGVGRDVTDRNRSEARRRALLGIAREVAGTLDLDRLFERTLGPTVESLGCDGAIVFREVAELEESRVIADLGFSPAQSQFLRTLTFGRGSAFGGRLARGETVVLRRAREVSPELVRRVLEPLGVRSMVAAPLYATGQFYGTLVAWSTREEAFDGGTISQCEAIARLLASAAGAAELYRLKNAESRLETAQARIAEDMISSLDVPVLLERVCRAMQELLDCDHATAFLYDGESDDFAPTATAGVTAAQWDVIRAVRIPRATIRGAVDRMERDGLVHVTADDVGIGDVLTAYGVRVGMMFALKEGTKLVGLLGIGRGSEGGAFDASDERAGRRIARLAALGLTNAQLVAQLETAHTLKSEFVATMSHELRTSLNVILGYSDLLLDGAFGSLAEDQHETIARISRRARDLCELVNATLDLSRLEAGRIELDLHDVRVADLLREVVEAQAEVPPGVQFRREGGPGLGVIRTDVGKLKVAIGNLLSNAFKFTERGRVTLAASVVRDGVEFRVSDTGPGIAAELQDAVFESFRQGDGSASRRHGGAGLGLYIVRQLAAVLGGTVELESEEGRGATFRLWTPSRPCRAADGFPVHDGSGGSPAEGVSPEEKAALGVS